MLAFALTASAQNVNVNPGGGSYATLADAFSAVNAGTHTGAITVEIIGDTTEPAAGAVLNASGAGAASYTSIVISPSGGAARTISGAATAGVPLIDLNGADNVTINGLNSGGNALTISNTTVSSTPGTSTIRFQADATSNTITNCSILGSSTMSAGTSGGNILFSTAAVGGNDNNIISNNNIGPVGTNLPTKAISGNGTSGFLNSGIQITGNNIFDFFNAAAASHGIYISTGNTDWSITGNKFYQTDVRTQTMTGTIHAAIQIANGSVNNCTISNNTIGYASAAGTGTYTFVGSGSGSKFLPIYFSVGSVTAASNIQNNTITAINLSGIVGGAGTAAAFNGISIASGFANISGNTIGSLTASGAISVTSDNPLAIDVHGICFFSAAAINISNNNVGGITAVNNVAGGLQGAIVIPTIQ